MFLKTRVDNRLIERMEEPRHGIAEAPTNGNGRGNVVMSRRPMEEEREEEILGVQLMDGVLGSMSWLWNGSHTVFNLDISRPRHRNYHLRDNLSRQPQFETSLDTPSDRHQNNKKPSMHWIQGIQGAGARLKLMQIWDFPDKETKKSTLPWGINIGIGATMDMERSGLLALKARVQSKHLALHLLPSPYAELRTKFPLGKMPLGIRMRYRLPLDDLKNIWESPRAYFQVNLYSIPGTGFNLSPGGLEFDEHITKIGKYTTIRVAASVQFPRNIPPEDGDEPFRIKVHRFGLKTRMV